MVHNPCGSAVALFRVILTIQACKQRVATQAREVRGPAATADKHTMHAQCRRIANMWKIILIRLLLPWTHLGEAV